jgi:hypothetical protein
VNAYAVADIPETYLDGLRKTTEHFVSMNGVPAEILREQLTYKTKESSLVVEALCYKSEGR